MADGDDQFRIGVQHGLDDAPIYRWQDAFYQDRYDAGYAVGQFQRLTTAYAARAGHVLGRLQSWPEFEALMKRRGLGRTRS